MKNKEIVQSYISTIIRYSSNLYEERLLIKVAEFLQRFLNGKRLSDDLKLDDGEEIILKTTVSELRSDNATINYSYIFNALKGISEKSVGVINGDDKVLYIPIARSAGVVISSGDVTISINPAFANLMLDFSKGYRRFESVYPFKMKSSYSIRIYKIIANQTNKIRFALTSFKDIIGVGDKYKDIKGIRNLLDRVRKEFVSVKAPYLFDYEISGRDNIISFIPIKNDASYADSKIEKQRCDTMALQKYIGDDMWNVLRDAKFTSLLLSKNKMLIQQFHDIPYSIGILHQLIEEFKDNTTYKYIILRRMQKEVDKHNKKLAMDATSKTIEDSYFYDGTEYV